jgi:flagellar assembly protein FliH
VTDGFVPFQPVSKQVAGEVAHLVVPEVSVVQGSGRPIELEDFGADLNDAPVVIKQPEPEEAPEPDPDLVSMTAEQVEELRAAAFQEGFEKGSVEKEEALRVAYTGSFSSLEAAFRAEDARRDEALQTAAESFVGTVVDIVAQLAALHADVLEGVRRDLVADAAAFVKECEGAVTVRCGPVDGARLQEIFKDSAAVRIEMVPELAEGAISIASSANTIVIDPRQWRKSVTEKIVAAVTALAKQRIRLNKPAE